MSTQEAECQRRCLRSAGAAGGCEHRLSVGFFFPTEIITYLPLVADFVEGNSPSSADCLPLWRMWKTQSGHMSTFMAHPPCQILFGEIFSEQSPSRYIYISRKHLQSNCIGVLSAMGTRGQQ